MNNHYKKAFQIIADVLDTDISKINSEDSITCWDSLAFLSIISNLEHEFGLSLPIEKIIEQAAKAKTIKELLMILGIEL